MEPVQRGAAVLAVTVAVALSAAAWSSFASGANAAPRAAAAGTITLRGRPGISGPWRSYLWLKLRRGAIPVSFSVCAVVDSKKLPPSCHGAPGVTLPAGARMRLEQRRGNRGAWKVVGISLMPFLDARLSNAVGGNGYGTVHYRVTLRARNGAILRTSNPFRVIWHR
jgi:hypothetical protein